jgi:hypothetical protein
LGIGGKMRDKTLINIAQVQKNSKILGQNKEKFVF